MGAEIVRPPLLVREVFCDDSTSSVVGESITTVLVSSGKLAVLMEKYSGIVKWKNRLL